MARRKVKIDILACARCGECHRDVMGEKLVHPAGAEKWWAMCPYTKQPTMLAELDFEGMSSDEMYEELGL